jgi:hypothetical protein
VFSQPKIEAQFKKFVTVRLYTGQVGPAGVHQVPDAPESTEFRSQKFGNDALPYYVIIKPKGKTLELFWAGGGLIHDADEFAGQLEKMLAAAK